MVTYFQSISQVITESLHQIIAEPDAFEVWHSFCCRADIDRASA